VLHEPVATPQELIQKINDVSSRDLRDVARYIFTNDKLNLAIIGPEQDKEKISGILKFS
jgi:predicted Zn-dependent peptidase